MSVAATSVSPIQSLVSCTDFRCVIPVELQFDLAKAGLEEYVATHEIGLVTDVTSSRRMRAVVQRVASASVSVDGEVVSSISKGLVVLLGIGADDKSLDSEYIAKKILSLRVFDDAEGAMWRQSVKDISGDVLCVSQFTLLANTIKGSKPDFHRAMGSEQSKEMYSAFLQRMRELYRPGNIKDGKFGAMMSVSLANDGPVTFTLDSRKFEYVQSSDSKPTKPSARAHNREIADQNKSGEV